MTHHTQPVCGVNAVSLERRWYSHSQLHKCDEYKTRRWTGVYLEPSEEEQLLITALLAHVHSRYNHVSTDQAQGEDGNPTHRWSVYLSILRCSFIKLIVNRMLQIKKMFLSEPHLRKLKMKIFVYLYENQRKLSLVIRSIVMLIEAKKATTHLSMWSGNLNMNFTLKIIDVSLINIDVHSCTENSP